MLDRFRSFIEARFNPKTYLGLHLTVGLLIGGLGVWAFSALLDAVLDNATLVRWDHAADGLIHRHVTPAGLNFFNWVSRIGSPQAMGIIAVIGGIILLVRKRPVMLTGWIAAFAGGELLEQVLKSLVHRHRPAYAAAYVDPHTFSFPSGHAMMSFIGMTAVLYVLWVEWRASWPARIVTVGAAVIAVILIGVSRIYLGVHYPSDVMGGWAAAATWMAVCISGVAFTLHWRYGRRPDS